MQVPTLSFDDLLSMDGSSFTPKFDPGAVARAADIGSALSDRLQQRQAQVRKAFVRRGGQDADTPPALDLLRASPAYLKLELTLLWASSGKGLNKRDVNWTPTLRQVREARHGKRKQADLVLDRAAGTKLLLPTDAHTTNFHLVDHAVLLGLRKPKSAGVQAVSRGLTHLAAAGLIWVGRADGAPPMVQIRREDGSGETYTIPGEPRVAIKGEKVVRQSGEGNYLRLPPELWTNGWLAALSGRALIALLVLLVQNDLAPGTPGTFLAPSKRDELYGFSEDTFYRGTDELAYYRLVSKTSEPVRPAWGKAKHTRNTFELRLQGLDRSPTDFGISLDQL